MIYKHYKGGLYKFLHTALMEGDTEAMIVYRHVNGGQVWIRPASEFFGNVAHPTKKEVRRFEQVHEEA